MRNTESVSPDITISLLVFSEENASPLTKELFTLQYCQWFLTQVQNLCSLVLFAEEIILSCDGAFNHQTYVCYFEAT